MKIQNLFVALLSTACIAIVAYAAVPSGMGVATDQIKACSAANILFARKD
ncbi:MAG: hypothetical protein WCA85_11805 [Paraburkholderia sp.]